VNEVRNKRRDRWKWIAIIVGVAALIMWPQLHSISKKGVRTALTPAESVNAGVSRRLSGWATLLRGWGGAADREKNLSLELVKAQAELNRLNEIENQNRRLLRALNFQQSTPYQLTPATVISRNISGWWNSIRIHPGNNQALQPDCAVLSPDGLVGRTLEINPFSTEVLLISDPAFRVAAKIRGREIFGLVRGMGQTLSGQPRVRMEFINKDTELFVGDEVATSGFSQSEGYFPANIHIGYIETIHQDTTGLYQYADIAPRATVGLLDYLFVVNRGEARP